MFCAQTPGLVDRRHQVKKALCARCGTGLFIYDEPFFHTKEVYPMTDSDSIHARFQPGQIVSGYKVVRVEDLHELESTCIELEHLKTGARHIHIANADEENTFSVAFKTVPRDSTGVAHILEHTVLCGSERFPVRDPFFSMIKRSLNTFMNAFTSSDWTMYPFSTQNRKDFYNLMDVYLDAAFFPKIEELSFKQEGHRLDVNEDGSLEYKGVVYNEMKGAMSSPSHVMGRYLLKALYPTSTYGWNSGGEPSDIPGLTWEQLKAFHATHYHPSNAYFYTYGNLNLEDHLTFIDRQVLSRFQRTVPDTEVKPEIRWDAPRQATYTYPLSRSESTSKKSQVCLAWLTADINDSFEVLVLTLLGHILMGNSASPLRKALIDSKLGSALCDASGFDSENRDTLFACGLKDVDPEDAAKIEAIIWDTLKGLAEKGVEKELISTAIHQIEFRRKERTNSPYPYGIKVLIGIAGSWFHGGDPVKTIRLDEDLERLNRELEKGPFFENLIRKHFLDNPHRVLFTLVPDQEQEERENRRVAEKLERIRAGLSESDIEKIREENKTLEAMQASEEDISCLPTLQVDDVPPDVTVVHPDSGYDGVPAACYRKPTSGIFYLVSAGGLDDVPEDLLGLMPFFCSAFTRLGTKKRDYASLARAMSAVTGGIGLDCHARSRYAPSPGCLPFLSFNGKCLNRNIAPFFDLVQECAFEYDFSDRERLKSLLLEYRAGLESSVVQNGHALAMSLASRHFSPASYLNELWHGVTQVKTIKQLADAMADPAGEKKTLDDLTDAFGRLATCVFKPGRFRFALVGEDEALKTADTGLAPLARAFASADGILPTWGDRMGRLETNIVREGWSTNSAVSFVAESRLAPAMPHEHAPGLAVIAKILRSLYLHREIREKGGAYGGFAVYNAEDGIFSMGSYRDPHIVTTLKVFEEAGDYLRKNPIRDEDVSEAVLQVCSGIDKPDTPGPAARKAFYRDIVGLDDDMRRQYKAGLLKVRKKDLDDLVDLYFTRDPAKASVAVISGEEKLKEANGKLGPRPLDLHKI